MTKYKKAYLLTKLGREYGYIGLLRKDEIDDSIRGTFTILREEEGPILVEYLQARLRQLSISDIEEALRKLVRVGLVSEVEQ